MVAPLVCCQIQSGYALLPSPPSSQNINNPEILSHNPDLNVGPKQWDCDGNSVEREGSLLGPFSTIGFSTVKTGSPARLIKWCAIQGSNTQSLQSKMENLVLGCQYGCLIWWFHAPNDCHPHQRSRSS